MLGRIRREVGPVLAAVALAAGPGNARGYACDAGEAVAAPGMPSPEELEAQGVRVGEIDIEVEDIFDNSKPGESSAPYRWANDLHLQTRDEAIRTQLLFEESEPYSRQKVAETERLLRGRRYLYDAWVEPTCYHPEDNTVDLHVRVRDVWTLNPGVHFSRAGGANNTGFELQDEDFFGRGELVSVMWASNVDRNTLRFTYEDPQVAGTWWRGRVAYSDNSDGRFSEFNFGRPFYSLDTRWSAGTGVDAGDRVDSRYQLGKILDSFDETVSRVELYGGRSAGLQDGWARRWIGGMRYDSSEFTADAGKPLVAPLPENRRLVYPWTGVEWIEDDFATTHNQDQLARTEDLDFGRSLRAEVGVASPAWGADRTAAIFAVSGGAGQRLEGDRRLFLSGTLGGRWESGGLSDTLLQGEARYYGHPGAHSLFYAGARGAIAVNPDLDHQLLLGGDNGLRGYPLRYQSGTGSALFTVEERLYTGWYPFHLFHVGAAAFADAGRTWGNDVAGEAPLGWLSDVGVGLRLGNTRSGLGNVLHIDVAVPLVHEPGIDSVQLLVQTRRSF